MPPSRSPHSPHCGSRADAFDGRALGVPSRGNATITASGVRLSSTLQLIDRNGVATSSNLSGTAVRIPRGALRLSIEGSDWEARVLGRFEAAISNALQDKVPPLVEAQLETLVAVNGTAALQRRPFPAPLNLPHLPHLTPHL